MMCFTEQLTNSKAVMWTAAFQRHSSIARWCEGLPPHQYAYHLAVSEFWNTGSSLLITVLALIGLYNYRRYYQQAKECYTVVSVLYGLLALVGLTSAWFHATGSLAGQLADELSITWLIIVMLWSDPTASEDRRSTYHLIGTLAFSSWTLGQWPHLNAMIMMLVGCCLAPRTAWRLWQQPAILVAPLFQAVTCFLLAVITWCSDHHFCGHWWLFSGGHCHWCWHLAIGLGGLQLIHMWAVLLHYRYSPTFVPGDVCWQRWAGLYWSWGVQRREENLPSKVESKL